MSETGTAMPGMNVARRFLQEGEHDKNDEYARDDERALDILERTADWRTSIKND